MTLTPLTDQVFDAISYSKGACSIRMLDAFLTEVTPTPNTYP